MTIMSVRRTLSETETDRYGKAVEMNLATSTDCQTSMRPIAALTMLTLGAVVSLWRTKTRTQRAEVREAGEGGGPEVLGVDKVATIELEELVLCTRVREHSIKQRTDQKTVG